MKEHSFPTLTGVRVSSSQIGDNWCPWSFENLVTGQSDKCGKVKIQPPLLLDRTTRSATVTERVKDQRCFYKIRVYADSSAIF